MNAHRYGLDRATASRASRSSGAADARHHPLRSSTFCLRRLSCGEVDAEQLQHLIRVSRQPNVSLRVIPLAGGLHRGNMTSGTFTILEFEGGAEPSIVYSDSLTGALYLDKPAEVATYGEAWDIMENPALTEAQSRKLMASIAEELT
ncbi:Scr1 family TA system antitoxin-like transcriptional regulator [Micromonospora sp. NPDC049171]|uniref:Scr1 family TA system antitoxin-like transcriptional regulator n=1 Tax=Micromonospora sp. NPDC049171 TaxID=3155770 RepID=UPI0033E34083